MDETGRKIKISICMGSSCFSRGNNENLNLIKKYIAENAIAADIDLVGCLCQNKCNDGPIITIDEHLFENVEPITVADILAFALKGRH